MSKEKEGMMSAGQDLFTKIIISRRISIYLFISKYCLYESLSSIVSSSGPKLQINFGSCKNSLIYSGFESWIHNFLLRIKIVTQNLQSSLTTLCTLFPDTWQHTGGMEQETSNTSTSLRPGQQLWSKLSQCLQNLDFLDSQTRKVPPPSQCCPHLLPWMVISQLGEG